MSVDKVKEQLDTVLKMIRDADCGYDYCGGIEILKEEVEGFMEIKLNDIPK